MTTVNKVELALVEDLHESTSRTLTTLVMIVSLLASTVHLQFQDAKPAELLPPREERLFQSHSLELYNAASKLGWDLRLSIADERVLFHLPGRGFPHLASLIESPYLTQVVESLFTPSDASEKSYSREEAVTDELLTRAVVVRLAAHRSACFQLCKELAPTPEALKCDAQARELSARLFPETSIHKPTVTEFLQDLESIRMLFEQLRTLPKLTIRQMADERAARAALSPGEYEGHGFAMLPVSGSKWVSRELKWHREWHHDGYLMAFSELTGPRDFEQFEMVVNLKGGIFEWNQPHGGSHEHPDCFESRLPETEFLDLKKYLAKLPPSDRTGKDNHFVVSFLDGARWRTRTYSRLPQGSPFENFLERMVRRSVQRWREDSRFDDGYLKVYPKAN